ncbi:hypothetical protein BKA82DRAFT_3971205, partial [Pisolithus tinctorius]
RLVFANNLSVYDTFSSAVYDRRSEPATWSHLTPTLAQRIKDELNSYKMEIIRPDICSYTGRPQTRKNEMSGRGRVRANTFPV